MVSPHGKDDMHAFKIYFCKVLARPPAQPTRQLPLLRSSVSPLTFGITVPFINTGTYYSAASAADSLMASIRS